MEDVSEKKGDPELVARLAAALLRASRSWTWLETGPAKWPKGYASQVRHAKRVPGKDLLIRAADALGVEYAWLATEKGPMVVGVRRALSSPDEQRPELGFAAEAMAALYPGIETDEAVARISAHYKGALDRPRDEWMELVRLERRAVVREWSSPEHMAAAEAKRFQDTRQELLDAGLSPTEADAELGRKPKRKIK